MIKNDIIHVLYIYRCHLAQATLQKNAFAMTVVVGCSLNLTNANLELHRKLLGQPKGTPVEFDCIDGFSRTACGPIGYLCVKRVLPGIDSYGPQRVENLYLTKTLNRPILMYLIQHALDPDQKARMHEVRKAKYIAHLWLSKLYVKCRSA